MYMTFIIVLNTASDHTVKMFWETIADVQWNVYYRCKTKLKKQNKTKQTTNTHTKNKKQKRKVLKIRLLVLAVHLRETRKDANETRRDSREARLVSRVLSEMRLARWW